jgi:hypothetical protein
VSSDTGISASEAGLLPSVVAPAIATMELIGIGAKSSVLLCRAGAGRRRAQVQRPPGTVVGTVVYLQTGRLWQALALACLVGPPIAAAQRVIARRIDLLAPPKRWRRPHRRGS